MPDQRAINVNVLIACAGPGVGEVSETPYGPVRSRDGTTLKHAYSDVELMDRYWSADSSDQQTPNIILENPTRSDFRQAIDRANHFLNKFPTSKTGIDFYFAGHCGHDGGLVFSDGAVYADDYLEMLSDYRSTDGGRRGFGYILDCCHSGAFLFKTIEIMERDGMRDKLRMYDALASSMYDEKSLEFDFLGHGVFTFAFAIREIDGISTKRLNEIIDSAPKPDLALKSELVNDLKAMSLGPFTPPASRLTTFLTQKRQTPVDCVNGHYIDAGSRGEVEIADWEKTVNVGTLLDAFSN